MPHFRYPFPTDPGAQVQTAAVLFQVTLEDGRQVTYTGHATRADYDIINDLPSPDLNSPSGVAQSARSTIDWVSGSVRRTDNLADWAAEQKAIEARREPQAGQAQLPEGRKEITT